MLATDIGIAFVVLATITLVATLVGMLIWLVYVIITGFSRGRRA